MFLNLGNLFFFFFNNAEAHLSFLGLKSSVMECQALVFIEVTLYSLKYYDT